MWDHFRDLYKSMAPSGSSCDKGYFHEFSKVNIVYSSVKSIFKLLGTVFLLIRLFFGAVCIMFINYFMMCVLYAFTTLCDTGVNIPSYGQLAVLH
jgi:hypothetical protein